MSFRVLQLGKFHPIKGGVEKVMYTFMVGLSRNGLACDMLCASADGEVGTTEIDASSNLLKTPTIIKLAATMISPQMIVKLRSICNSYDIIHVHHPDPMATLALRLSGYKGKVIVHWHSDIVKQRILLQAYKPLQNWLIKRADNILGTSPVYVQESLALKAYQHKIDYLPIGVRKRDADENLVAMIRNKYPGKKIIFTMGRLVEYKGYDYLIEAASLLPNNYIILIGGSGPLKEDLRDTVKGFLLNRKVRIIGFVPRELESAYYAACDIFCLSSTIKTEAYAIVQAEAMSAGKPVIATNIPGSGVSWVNQHGVSGLNVEPGNSRELAQAIRTICEDDELYRKLSLGALRRFEENFTLEAMTKGLIDIYKKVLNTSD